MKNSKFRISAIIISIFAILLAILLVSKKEYPTNDDIKGMVKSGPVKVE